MAAIASSQAGNWSDTATWIGAVVPTNGDAVTVDHAITIDSDIAFDSLDNNSTLTKDATARIVIVTGGGAIDNAGGTIDTNTNDGNITFKSSNATKWTWALDTGTFDWGSGVHTFEYGSLSVGNIYAITKGTWDFAESMHFEASAANKIWTFDTASTVNFTAGKDHTIGDGTNLLSLSFKGTINMVGSLGSEITFTCDTNTGELYFLGTGSLVADIQYVSITTGRYGWRLESFDTTAGDSLTFENNKAISCSWTGIYINTLTGATTLTDCESYSSTQYGIQDTGTTGVVTYDGCTSYSNSYSGFQTDNIAGVNYTRCKAYSNTWRGFMFSNADRTNTILESCLAYENSQFGIEIFRTDGTSKIINCTSVDNIWDGVSVTLLDGDTLPITNSIFYSNRWGISSLTAGTAPIVTACDVYDNSTANYNGLGDQTGTAGNISADPLFKDAAADNYDIFGNSPCVNAGTSTGAPANDITDTAWPNANPEIGAYGELAFTFAGGEMSLNTKFWGN